MRQLHFSLFFLKMVRMHSAIGRREYKDISLFDNIFDRC
jgi:hypothetical protein